MLYVTIKTKQLFVWAQTTQDVKHLRVSSSAIPTINRLLALHSTTLIENGKKLCWRGKYRVKSLKATDQAAVFEELGGESVLADHT